MNDSLTPTDGGSAFGRPGMTPRWTSSSKEGVGTAYSTASCVWFTLSHGILNEIYYPLCFTFFWPEAKRWEGRNYEVEVRT